MKETHTLDSIVHVGNCVLKFLQDQHMNVEQCDCAFSLEFSRTLFCIILCVYFLNNKFICIPKLAIKKVRRSWSCSFYFVRRL
jgi:hypothetical protein